MAVSRSAGGAAERPRIVVDVLPDVEADLFTDELLGRLAAVGELIRTGGAGGASRAGAEVLITGWGTEPLPASRADAGPLQLVVHSAGTIRKLVPRSLIEDGVRVSQSAAGMARSVAEFALFTSMSLLRDLHRVDRAMHVQHDWRAASAFGLGHTVAGTRIGVVGASRVGRIYIELVRAAGAEVVVYDPYLPDPEAERMGVERVALDDLLRTCPLVAVHAPVTTETRGLLSADRLALLRDGGMLVNTARSAVLDSAALERELLSGRLSAALDVFDEEPLPAGSLLWGLPNVLLTPHLGAVTVHSRRAQAAIAVEEVERYCRGEDLLHEVRADAYERIA